MKTFHSEIELKIKLDQEQLKYIESEHARIAEEIKQKISSEYIYTISEFIECFYEFIEDTENNAVDKHIAKCRSLIERIRKEHENE